MLFFSPRQSRIIRSGSSPSTPSHNGAKESFSYPEYQYIRDHNQGFSGVAALNYGFYKYDASFGKRYELATPDVVSDNYFDVMGIQPFLGRLFASGDDHQRAAEAVLTYSCWQRWGADREIAGKTVTINRHSLTIIGVAPKSLISPVFGFAADVIVNIGAPGNIGAISIEDRQARAFQLIGRLKPGVTRGQARAEVQALWRQLAAAYPNADRNRAAELTNTTVLSPDDVETAASRSGVDHSRSTDVVDCMRECGQFTAGIGYATPSRGIDQDCAGGFAFAARWRIPERNHNAVLRRRSYWIRVGFGRTRSVFAIQRASAHPSFHSACRRPSSRRVGGGSDIRVDPYRQRCERTCACAVRLQAESCQCT